jgi:uncharacterized OsmC-like protein
MSDRFEVSLTLRAGYEFVVDFGDAGELVTDEAPPLGHGHGPNPARLLAAAVANCLGASLLFCLRRARIDVATLRATVTGTTARNERGRLRIGELQVTLEPGVPAEMRERLPRCLEIFEDFCIVTESVRQGIPVRVDVRPAVPEATPSPAS